MFRSATLRLTLWYLALAMAISILFSVALYNVTTSQLHQGLNSESQSLYNDFPVFQNDHFFNFHPESFYNASSHRILLRLVGFNLIVFVAAGFSSYWLARRTLEPIEAAHEQQKRFTSDVSHELRTPLTAIKMESEVALINKQTSPKELRSTLQSNIEEVQKLEALINNILRLSRLEVDELQQNFTVLSSHEVIGIASSEIAKVANDHKIEIHENKDDSLVLGNRESLVQLLVILLDNAIKYSPAGSSIKVETTTTKDQVIWRVKDEGSGIEPEALKHVFDRFYRSDSSRTKRSSDGYGLGLSIAKMIADVHKATITLNSEVGKGTMAVVILPKNN